MSAEAYVNVIEETLWEETKMEHRTLTECLAGTKMQHRSLDELIEDAREILDEISSRVFRPLHSDGESRADCEISTDDSGESPKRRSFKPDENGMKPTNHGRAWSEKDIEMAQAFKLAGWSNAKIANHFSRNRNGVRKMLNKRSK